MYQIGDFARLSGLSIKTLRFYDEIGLLKPETVAFGSGYRLYTLRQLERAARIRALRQLGFSLEEIRRTLAARTHDRATLEEARQRLRKQLAEKQRELATVEAALELIEAGPHARISTKDEAPRWVASIRDRVARYADADELAQELFAAVPRTRRGRMRGALWHCCEAGRLECEVFLELEPGVRARGRARVEELSGATVAWAQSTTDDAEAEETYGALKGWLHANGKTLAGPKRELFHGDGPLPLIEIQFPVAAAT